MNLGYRCPTCGNRHWIGLDTPKGEHNPKHLPPEHIGYFIPFCGFNIDLLELKNPSCWSMIQNQHHINRENLSEQNNLMTEEIQILMQQMGIAKQKATQESKEHAKEGISLKAVLLSWSVCERLLWSHIYLWTVLYAPSHPCKLRRLFVYLSV